MKTLLACVLSVVCSLVASGQEFSNPPANVPADKNTAKSCFQVGKTIYDFSALVAEQEKLYEMQDVVIKELVKVSEQMAYLIAEMNARNYSDPDYDSKKDASEKKHAIAQKNSANADKKREILMDRRARFREQNGKFWVDGKVLHVLGDGLIVTCDDADEDKTLTGYKGPVFVEGSIRQKGVVDGDPFRSWGVPSGRFQYVNTQGAQKTIPRFSAANIISRSIDTKDVKQLPK